MLPAVFIFFITNFFVETHPLNPRKCGRFLSNEFSQWSPPPCRYLQLDLTLPTLRHGRVFDHDWTSYMHRFWWFISLRGLNNSYVYTIYIYVTCKWYDHGILSPTYQLGCNPKHEKNMCQDLSFCCAHATQDHLCVPSAVGMIPSIDPKRS